MKLQLTVTFLALVPLLAAASPALAPITKVPFFRRRSLQRENGVVDIPALNAHVEQVRAKIARGFAAFKANTGQTHPNDVGNAPPTKRTTAAQRTTATVPLTSDLDGSLWQGGVSVGTPLNAFTVDFDTGSSDFFLPGPTCTTNCAGHKVYDTSASSTAIDQHQPFSIEFGDNSTVSGEVFRDTVSLGGLVATNQAVVAASQYSEGFAIDESPPDGLLGMAFQSIATTASSPVFQTLVSQGKVTSPVFGFTLLDNGGELFLGGTDTTAFTGSLTFAPLTTAPAFWQILTEYVSVGKTHVVSIPNQAIVDTGTTLLIVDTDSARAIYDRIPGSLDAENTVGEGFFTVPCDAIPSDISFTIAGKAFTLSADSFNLGAVESGSNTCVGGIIVQDLLGFWILGDVFLRNVYTEFDAGKLRVGFAPVVG